MIILFIEWLKKTSSYFKILTPFVGSLAAPYTVCLHTTGHKTHEMYCIFNLKKTDLEGFKRKLTTC